MKSASVLVGLLASVGAAQPHANHRHLHRRVAAEKRGHGGGVATEWVTHWETATMVEEIGESTTKFYPYTPSGGAWSSSPPVPTDAHSEDAQPQPQPSSTSTSSAIPTAPSVPEQPSSSYVAPAAATTSSLSQNVLVVPTLTTPHTTFVSSTTPASVATPSSGGSTGSSGGSTGGYQYSGDLTFYTLGMGSCGIDNTNDDNSVHVVAVPIGQMSSWTGNPNNNPNCGRTVEISHGGKTATATVVDTCGGCADGALDCSMSLFLEFGVEADGRLHGMEWKYAS